MKNYRLAAAGIIIYNNNILLVRYKTEDNSTFLVGPEGGVEPKEDLKTALKREVYEETGLTVKPEKILFLDDLFTAKYRMLKVWFLCDIIKGTIVATKEAQIEGIIDVAWYTKNQLQGETVYPKVLLNHDWNDFLKDNFKINYLGLEKADF